MQNLKFRPEARFENQFYCGGNRSTRRKPPTCHKSTLSHNVVLNTVLHLAMNG